MKNYYFNSCFDVLDENVIDNCSEICYIVVNDIKKLKAFCDKIYMIDDGITSNGLYYFNENYEQWREINQYLYPRICRDLGKYLNKTEDDTRENDTMDSEEKTFNYSIEFVNDSFISEENCDKSFDEIFNSVKDLYNSVVFGNIIRKIVIEMN